ncbi:uncharacterized protein PAN0_019c5792 [Moesziomyces antarcticus]|uniref:Uncharacterized protein n=2 Tax=Pseudozyma antarctica TaxID=84753 RepID=A0A5C3FZ68_PSEA2|nr:uncharacterized protein PAN0_019c5792 [Moesziomyces antarcticus]GAK67564.1 hypothetical protein PAN0_019c5792 [Moesziomyces antarcticus]SPO48829.1 uncharacterized protein PSANT_06520 [Moesziomyces antarcticus]
MKINPIVLFALSSSAVVLAAPTPQGWNLLKGASKLVGKGKGESSSAARALEDDFKWDGLPEGSAGGSSKAPSGRSSPKHARVDIEQPAPQRPVTPPSAAAPAVQAHPGAQHAPVAAPHPQYAPSGPPAPGMYYTGPPTGHYQGPPQHYSSYPGHDDSMIQYLNRYPGHPRIPHPDTEWLTWSAAERHNAQMEAERQKERTGWFW